MQADQNEKIYITLSVKLSSEFYSLYTFFIFFFLHLFLIFPIEELSAVTVFCGENKRDIFPTSSSPFSLVVLLRLFARR